VIETELSKVKIDIHLTGLNGIRCIAAFAVVISHTFQYLYLFNLPQITVHVALAAYGVSIFFSLSGFLITYLLLIEQRKGISIKKFYLRRMLRIFPLYYLYLALSLLFPHDNTYLPFYVFYAANIPYILSVPITVLAHFWSLGVEEQFYSFYPWLVKFSKRHLFNILVLIAGVLLALKLFFRYAYGDNSIPYLAIHVTRFHCMMFGGMSAILYYKKSWVIKYVIYIPVQLLAWFSLLLMAFNMFHIASVIDGELASLIGIVLILGQITKRGVLNLENKIMDYLGKISYGVYVWHPILIFSIAMLLKNVSTVLWIKYTMVFISVIAATIIVSSLSFKYYEGYFLKLKKKYERVKTSQ
jgi:peptidoglycan/LPS O-acetylase OafA/YrhL